MDARWTRIDDVQWSAQGGRSPSSRFGVASCRNRAAVAEASRTPDPGRVERAALLVGSRAIASSPPVTATCQHLSRSALQPAVWKGDGPDELAKSALTQRNSVDFDPALSPPPTLARDDPTRITYVTDRTYPGCRLLADRRRAGGSAEGYKAGHSASGSMGGTPATQACTRPGEWRCDRHRPDDRRPLHPASSRPFHIPDAG